MKIFFIITFAIFCVSCNKSNFNALSSYNYFDRTNRYLLFKNDRAGIESYTYWDFTFPEKNSEIKKVRKGKIPFNNILLYANTNDPAYEYYILLNDDKPKKQHDRYLRKDTVFNGNIFSIIASKSIPKSDWKFILKNIHLKEVEKY